MSEKVPKTMRDKYDEIIALTNAVCESHLSEEYADLARKLTAKLARKRPSPLKSSRANSWACGIIYALGQINFLFDKSQDPHIPAAELCKLFGVAQSTGGNKAKMVRDAVKMSRFEPEWMLDSMVADSPLVWMVSVDGYILDARALPFPIQVEAYQKGLIPYVPGINMEELDELIEQVGYIQIVPLDELESDEGNDN